MAEPITPVALALRLMPKKRRLKKPSRLIFPRTIEFKYRKKMRALIKEMRDKVKEIIIPEIPGLVEERRDSYRMDQTIADKIKALIEAVTGSIDGFSSDEQLQSIVEEIGGDINTFNRTQVHKVLKSVLGIDLLSTEFGMEELTASFVSENVSLIKSVKQKYISEVEQTLLRGARAGLRHEAIAKQLVGNSNDKIKTRFGNAESRLELIARDQTNKFYGQLTEARQVGAGIDRYIWRTAEDERVRDEHAARNGEEFSWSRPPSDGHPGQPINCRCYAEPVIELEGS